MKAPLLFFLAHLSSISAFDLDLYKSQYEVGVGTPYKTAVTIAATNIIEYLATSPIPKSSSSAKRVLAHLNQEAKIFQSDLDSASNSSNILRQQLDQEVESLVANASQIEIHIGSIEKQLEQTTALIGQINAQVIQAQNQVGVAQSNVNTAEKHLQDETRTLKRREHCLIGGWLGHHICKLFNPGGIRAAQNDKNNALNDLLNQRQKLAQIQTQLGQLQQQQVNLQQQKVEIDTIKNNLTDQENQLNRARDNVISVDTQMKSVIAHVDALLGRSDVLVDVIKNLIDMETVIKPLTAIADQIMDYTTNSTDIDYLKEMKQKININLPLVQEKLPQYALIPSTY